MGVRGYEATAHGSDFDERWTEDIAKSQGRITDLGLYPEVTASYIIFKVGSTYYRRDGETGVVDDSNADATTLINTAISALDSTLGGRIVLKEAKHYLTNTVNIDRPLELFGMGKWATQLIADGNYAALTVGTGAPAEFGGVVYLKVANLGIHGKDPTSNTAPYGYADDVYTGQAAIRLRKGFDITLEDLTITRKEYAIAFDAPGGGSIYYTKINRVQYGYNYQGICTVGGFHSIVEIDNCQSYLNQRYSVQLTPSYTLFIKNVVCEADGWNIPDNTLAVFVVGGSGNIYVHNIHVNGELTLASPAQALMLCVLNDGAQCHLSKITLQSGAHFGLYVWGGVSTYPILFTLNDFLIGRLRDGGFMGDGGGIASYGFYSSLGKSYIYLRNGAFENCTLGMYHAGGVNEVFRRMNVTVDGVLYESGHVIAPFVDGSDPQDSGYLIDAGAEYARAYLYLPEGAQEISAMRIYGRSVVLEADAMRAEYVIYGGADNGAYTTHNGSIADHPSTSTNFAADDVIYWTITEAGVLALRAGDSVEVKALHEIAGGADAETDAYFRTVEIEYV